MSNELVSEWVTKVEEDWTALGRLVAGGVAEVADVVAFLAQQCAEKYLKALVRRGGSEPPPIHHLSALLDSLISSHPDLETLRLACESLSPYAVYFRYPGEEASEADTAEAVNYAEQIRSAARTKLGLVG